MMTNLDWRPDANYPGGTVWGLYRNGKYTWNWVFRTEDGSYHAHVNFILHNFTTMRDAAKYVEECAVLAYVPPPQTSTLVR